MKKILVILMVLAFLVSCKPQKIIQYVDRETVKKETIRDTTYLIKADSSWLKAYLECDSTNNVILKQITIEQGKSVSQSIDIKDIHGKAGEPTVKYIHINAKVDSVSIYFALKDTYEKDHQTEKERVIEYKKIYPKWLLFFAAIGLLTTVYGLWRLYKYIRERYLS